MSILSESRREGGVWVIVIFSLICLVASLWILNVLSAKRTSERDRVLREAMEFGSRFAARASVSSLKGTGPSSFRGLMETTRLKGAEIVPESGAMYLGKQLLVSYPTIPSSPPSARHSSGETTSIENSRIIYTKRLQDGRLILLTFRAPVYSKTVVYFVTATLFATLAGIVLSIGIIWIILGTLRSRQEVAATIKSAGKLTPITGAPDSTQTLIALFQQTVKELQQQKEKLEKLHIEDKKKAETVEGLAATLCMNLQAGYLLFDENGTLINFNGSGRSLLGLPVLLNIGDDVNNILSNSPETFRILEKTMEEKELTLQENVKGAPGVLLQVAALPLYNSYNHLRGYLLILKDRTKVYEMRNSLREREALAQLGEVAAGVAHEVRNALSTILANLELIGLDDPEMKSNKHFSALKEESSRLEEVVKNLLFYARPLPVRTETFPLKPFLLEEKDAISTYSKNIQINIECPDDAEFRADREALRSAIRNIVRNAAEAILSLNSSGGTIRFSLLKKENHAGILIEDDGPGIPEDMEEKMFSPFTSEKPGGTGLGLPIARKIAREQGGDLVVHSSELGGAGFLLTLPSENS